MKKFIGIVLVLTLLVTLCACGKSSGIGLELDEITFDPTQASSTAPDNTSASQAGNTATGTTVENTQVTTNTAASPTLISNETLPSGTPEVVTTNNSGTPVDSHLKDAVGNILKGDKYSMKFTVQAEAEGEKQTMPVAIYVSGKKKLVEATMYNLMKLSLLYDGSETYMIIPLMKGYIKMSADQAGGYDDMFSFGDSSFIDTDNMKYIETTKVNYKGTEYLCETYESDGVTTKYYFKDSQLKRIESIEADGTTTIMENIEISPQVDDSVFKIPSGYKEISEDDLGSLSSLLG